MAVPPELKMSQSLIDQMASKMIESPEDLFRFAARHGVIFEDAVRSRLEKTLDNPEVDFNFEDVGEIIENPKSMIGFIELDEVKHEQGE